MKEKLLLSLDLSTKSSGWSIFNMVTNELVAYGRVEKYRDEESDMRKRVMYMMDNIRLVINKYEPCKVVMEDVVPTINNSATVKALAILQGVIIGMCHTLELEYDFVSVATWHSELGILKSKGDLKEQSINIANGKYKIDLLFKSPSSKLNSDDIADAINIGSYYLGDYEKQPKKTLSRKNK